MHGPIGSFLSGPKPEGVSDLMYQIRQFHSYLWTSGGCYSDFYIHNIDECCWMKGSWPVQAQAAGGRHYRGNSVDQNFDNYSVEYTFADGAKLFLYGRCIAGCWDEFGSYAARQQAAGRDLHRGRRPLTQCHLSGAQHRARRSGLEAPANRNRTPIGSNGNT